MANIDLKITNERREDMLVGALEGGSNYWYFIPEEATDIIDRLVPDKTQPLATRMYKALLQGATLPIDDIENGDRLGDINLESIEKGEQLMATNHDLDFMAIINEEDDASTADLWFQYAVMGEIVYG